METPSGTAGTSIGNIGMLTNPVLFFIEPRGNVQYEETLITLVWLGM